MLLFLKVILVPLLIGGVTLAARRWGPQIGGVFTALPVVAGPAFSFFAIEQGHAFAANAAQATMFGAVALAAFCIAYGLSARRAPWPVSVLLGLVAFFAATPILYRAHLSAGVELLLAVAALLLARYMVPMPGRAVAAPAHSAWDVPLRMLAAAALVLLLTSAGGSLGSTWSGILTAFPTAVTIVAVFTHAQRGAEAVLQFLRGVVPGLMSFTIFCFVMAIALPASTLPAALASALAAQIALQSVIVLRIRSSSREIPATQ